MNKDVIYVDIEDDITAIIGKVKAAHAKIVALVPPKRAGVLQSVVNLKLLQKAADTTDKRVVLITNDHSLTALAAGIKMPVARNLQSRPEVPQLEAPQTDEEEIINGAELSVGEMAAAMGGGSATQTLADEMSGQVDLSDAAAKSAAGATAGGPAPKPSAVKKAGSMLKMPKIPDFATFRNKFFLFGGLGVMLLIVLIWALVFAPHASVTISAQTTAVNVDDTLTLDPKVAASDPAKFTLKPQVQQLKKSVANTFTATGTKDIGGKATGTMHIINCDSSSAFNVAAGTVFTSSDGHTFTSNAAATVPGFSGSASACQNSGTGAGTADIPVTATAQGDEYNVPAGSFSMSGFSGFIYARTSAAMSGGSHQQATVVSQDDVDKAMQQLTAPNTNDAKNQIKKQFTGDVLIIDESFIAETGKPTVDPAVGQPAQQAKITVETTYTYIAVQRPDLKTILTTNANNALAHSSSQQIYALGDNSLRFQTFQKQDDGTYKVHMNTVSYIGPKIDTKALAKQIAGKRFGEIQALITQIQGIDKVDVNFSPFWVTTAPGPDKTEISFSIANGQ
jgi:hypothetical protein